MAEFLVSRRAEQEFREICGYIAAKNPRAAVRLLPRIDAKLQRSRDFPELGPRRDEIRPGFRMLIEGNYLLLYEYDTANEVVVLVTVVDSPRDLEHLE